MNQYKRILVISTDIDLIEKLSEIFGEYNYYFSFIGKSSLSENLNKDSFNLILADYSETQNIVDDIELLQNEKSHKIPIILLIDEKDENAILYRYDNEIVDYTNKHNLQRLILSIPREIQNSKVNIEHSLMYSEINKNYYEKIISNLPVSNLEFSQNFDVQSFFQRIFQQFPIGIALINANNGKVIDINNTYLDLIEYQKDEIINKSNIYMKIWKNKGSRQSIIDFIVKFGIIKNKEEIFLTKNGIEKNVLISAIYLPNEIHNKNVFLFLIIDITNIKIMENNVLHALEKEKNLNILKTRFISMISHEFRTPLTTIMLSSDILRNYGQNWSFEEKEKHFSRIQFTILNLIQLLENVIIISKIDTDEFELHYENIDIKSFIESVAQSTLINYNSKSMVDIIIEDDYQNVLIDENLISLILNNLLSNAIKYSQEYSKIIIKTTIDRKINKLIISVKDNGIGIPDEELNNIYESFYRAANVGNKSGFGLGLTIVKKCVDKLNGRIKIESTLNSHSKISIILPLIEYKK